MYENVIDKLISTLVAQEKQILANQFDFLPDDDGDFHAMVVKTVADVTPGRKGGIS
jgi:hypothetical protein